MKRCMAAGIVAAVCMIHGCKAEAAGPRVENFTLQNGIRVISIHVPGSKNVSIFSFVPMGLAADGAGHAQWSHLVEHLTIRSTVPDDSQAANAETLPDHMRLDFYGTVESWREGLAHHAKWLGAAAFTAESLAREKARVCSECDVVAGRLATHKFAAAAWAQGYRYGSRHVALKGDVVGAGLGEIIAYRDRRMVVRGKTVVCIVGGIDAGTLRPVVSGALGGIRAQAGTVETVKPQPGDRRMSWDLKARHLLLTWPIPAVADERYAALTAAGHVLTMQLMADSALKETTGMVLAGADLATPEGNFFYVSASVKPQAAFEQVQRALRQHVAALQSNPAAPAQAAMLASQLAQQLTTCPDPALYRAQAPNVSATMIEANVGLQWAMQDFRYGPRRRQLAASLQRVTAQKVSRAAAQLLTAGKCSACIIEFKDE